MEPTNWCAWQTARASERPIHLLAFVGPMDRLTGTWSGLPRDRAVMKRSLGFIPFTPTA